MATTGQNWLRQAVRRSPWQGQQQVFILALLAFFLAIVVAVLYLAQVAELGTVGRELEQLLIERDRYEQRNEQLRIEIAELRSVPRLLARAEEIGFRYALAAEVEYLSVEGYNPDPMAVAALLENTTTDAGPVYDETFGGWLRNQVDTLRRQFEQFNRLSEAG